MEKHEFEDELGRQWSVRITHGLMREVREQTGFAFGTSLVDGSFLDMLNDLELLGRVTSVLVATQAKGRDVSNEAFLEGFYGDTFYRAGTAIAEAFAFFCPVADRKMIDAFLSSNLEMKLARAKVVQNLTGTSGLRDSDLELSTESIPSL